MNDCFKINKKEIKMYCSFKILLTDDYLLQCSIITEDEKEEIIKLNENELYPINIQFTQNELIICQKKTNTNTIEFMKEFIELFMKKEIEIR